MRKSILKRFKITKKGKLVGRIPGQNHFRAKKTGKQIRQKKGYQTLSPRIAHKIRKYLSVTK